MPERRGASIPERRERRAAVEEVSVILEAAAAFIAVRPRSIAETRRRLLHLGYRHDLAEEAIGRFIEVGYLDDVEFARAWVESRDRSRPRGEMALRRELALKGVDRETVAAALAERPGDSVGAADVAAARALLQRRPAALRREGDPRKRRQKAYALLARSGFAPEVCRAVSAEVVGAMDDDIPDG